MSIAQFIIDMIKVLLPVTLTAFLAAIFYFRNKQVDYSLKLSEKALDQIYDPIILLIEKKISENNFVYEGITFRDLEEIESIISKNRHLVDDKMMAVVTKYQKEFHSVSANHYNGRDPGGFLAEQELFDPNQEVYKTAKEIQIEHLKKMGYYKRKNALVHFSKWFKSHR